MKHTMKLKFRFFFLIQEHKKTIEMRLNDEKRQKIKVGDIIEFTDLKYGGKLSVEVIEIKHFNNFKELYDNYDKKDLGYLYFEDADYKDMEKYYTQEQQEKNGVLAIKIKLIKEAE